MRAAVHGLLTVGLESIGEAAKHRKPRRRVLPFRRRLSLAVRRQEQLAAQSRAKTQ